VPGFRKEDGSKALNTGSPNGIRTRVATLRGRISPSAQAPCMALYLLKADGQSGESSPVNPRRPEWMGRRMSQTPSCGDRRVCRARDGASASGVAPGRWQFPEK
jgi:hypothetical protein